MIPRYEKTKSYLWSSCLGTVSLFDNFILMAIPPYPAGKIALFWRIAESFHVKECISDSIGEEKAMAILILAMKQLTGRK